ncbi:DNA cytosine methyltransferase [Candidatus Pacearchaeota archaeon]|nr:DNA cytosine methyltransferase [Candidatus Pacearchaeota archaeon]
MTIKVLDLFAGAGGLALGLESVKDKSGRPVFEMFRAVEMDNYACDTLRENFGQDKVIEGDLTTRRIHKKVIGDCKGRVDVVVGGIPCQSFSLLGPRSGYGLKDERFKDDRRDDLYKEFRTIVKELRPKVVIIENVKGILSKKNQQGKKIIEILLKDFEKLGYHFSWGDDKPKYAVLNAADFGVPQMRERVIIVGILSEWKNVDVPIIKPTHFDPDANNADELRKKGLLPHLNMGEAIGDLQKVRAKLTFTGMNKAETELQKTMNKRIYSGDDRIPFIPEQFTSYLDKVSESGKAYFSFVRPNGYPSINYHVARPQQRTDIELFKAMKQGETAKEFIGRKPELSKKLIKYKMDTFEDKYRKQRWKAKCTTIFAHLQKDGNRFIHPKQVRSLTPREAARIQSFPDYYIIEGPYSKKFKQIGNAVPPLMAYNIGNAIYKIFGGAQ